MNRSFFFTLLITTAALAGCLAEPQPADEDTASAERHVAQDLKAVDGDSSGTLPPKAGKTGETARMRDLLLEGWTCTAETTTINGQTTHQYKCSKCFVTAPGLPPDCRSVTCDQSGGNCQPDSARPASAPGPLLPPSASQVN